MPDTSSERPRARGLGRAGDASNRTPSATSRTQLGIPAPVIEPLEDAPGGTPSEESTIPATRRGVEAPPAEHEGATVQLDAALDATTLPGMDAPDDVLDAATELSPVATAPTLAATVDGGEAYEEAASEPPRVGVTTRGGTTVLPHVEERDGRRVLVPRKEPRYAVEKVLGEGGMGIVELARDGDIGRDVAIKRLRGEAAQSARSLARFVEEVRTVGRLDHPSIAPIHDVGLDADGSFYFVMKYVDGETLEDVILGLRKGDAAMHRRYPMDRRVGIVVSVLHALDYAHASGLLHRDLKPANVMIGRFGEVLLMDWGIARPIGASEGVDADEIAQDVREATGTGRTRLVATRLGSVIGTPLYMSPEQARGVTAELEPRSDLFSVAMLALELLSTRHPLEEVETVAGICGRLQDFSPPSLIDPIWDSPHQEPVPAELRHFLHKALSPDPAARFESASSMVEELERVRAGDFAVQCPVTFMKVAQHRSIKMADKHPMMLGAAGIGAVVAFLVSTTGFLYLLLAG